MMWVIMKRELNNYSKNPIFWVGFIMVVMGVYQLLSPYLGIHYFQSDEEIQELHVTTLSDADIMDGYIPTTPKQQKELGIAKIQKSLKEDMNLSDAEVTAMLAEISSMDIPEICLYLEQHHYLGAENTFEEYAYYQGNTEDVNHYIKENMQEHSFSYYFSRKFADFAGLYLAIFSIIVFAFLFLQDTRKSAYELLHTKPVRAWQYVLGKILGGFAAIFSVTAALTLIFLVVCSIRVRGSGFSVNPLDFFLAVCLYILPNLLMIICVFAVIALLFKNPLPAVPLLFLYLIYSNMGSMGEGGQYGYYGRPLAIMVRFPGPFFDTAPPSLVLLNQSFLLLASLAMILSAIALWNRRRVY